MHSLISSNIYIKTRSWYSTKAHPRPDITQLSPLLQHQWHHAKTAHLGNVLIKPLSQRKVWWVCNQCPDGHRHEWETTVANRSHGTACPFCSNRAVCLHNSLLTKAPAVAAQFSSKNQGTAHDYMVSSHKMLMWQCEQGHEWQATIDSRKHGRVGCPKCFAIRKSSLPKQRHPTLTNSQHPILKCWDWKLNEEAGLDPSLITCSSGIVANWFCSCCPKGQPHRWQAKVAQLYHGSRCPICAGRKACICNSLQALFPEVAAEWDHSRNNGTPADCTAYSAAKVWWYNNKQGHSQAVVHIRTVN